MSGLEYILRRLNEWGLTLVDWGGFLPHSFPGLLAMITGANCLASPVQDGDFKKYSQAAAETPFVLERLSVFSEPAKKSPFLLVEIKPNLLICPS